MPTKTKKRPSTDGRATVESGLDERLDHLAALVSALSTEIDLLRAERQEWRVTEEEALEAAERNRVRPGREELRAVANRERSEPDLARVTALELVAAGLDRDAVAAELERLGMEDPEPVVNEVFRHEDPVRRAS
jgi:hypothetical protein